jgi:glutamine synthetase
MKDFRSAEWRRKVTEVVREVKELQIGFAHLPSVDVSGIPKSLTVPMRDLELIFEDGRFFDGSFQSLCLKLQMSRSKQTSCDMHLVRRLSHLSSKGREGNRIFVEQVTWRFEKYVR